MSFDSRSFLVLLFKFLTVMTCLAFQEGFNSKTNGSFGQLHPSPGIQLTNVVSQIREAEGILRMIEIGAPKRTQRQNYQMLSKMRLNMKKTYIEDRRPGGLVKKEAMLTFLANMGSNLYKSIQKERRLKINKISRSNKDGSQSSTDVSTSTKRMSLNSSTLKELTQPSNPYFARQIGITAKKQAEKEARALWMGEKCTGCKRGFNLLSKVKKCKDCNSFFM